MGLGADAPTVVVSVDALANLFESISAWVGIGFGAFFGGGPRFPIGEVLAGKGNLGICIGIGFGGLLIFFIAMTGETSIDGGLLPLSSSFLSVMFSFM